MNSDKINIVEFPSNLGLKKAEFDVEPGVKKLPHWLKEYGFHKQINPEQILGIESPVYSMDMDKKSGVRNADKVAPKLGQIPSRFQKQVNTVVERQQLKQDDKVRIKGIIVDEITQPLNDGSRGSALYKIPFELNRRPNNDWIDLFIQAFNHPPRFTMMHRPGIASVSGNKIYLDGTTIEEVEQYHKKTLKLAVEAANNKYADLQSKKRYKEEQEEILEEQRRKNIEDINKRLNFDD